MDKATRESKSQRLALRLRSMGAAKVTTDNPYKDELEKAAKHIEWLELIVTGLSYNEKRTIASLTRRVGTLERMVERRDEKLKNFNDWHKDQKRHWNEKTRELKSIHKFELKEAKKISDTDRHKIEKDFIKHLRTSVEIQNALNMTRWDGHRRLYLYDMARATTTKY